MSITILDLRLSLEIPFHVDVRDRKIIQDHNISLRAASLLTHFGCVKMHL